MASSRRRAEPISSNPLAETPFHFFKVFLPATLEEKKLVTRNSLKFEKYPVIVSQATYRFRMIPEKFVRKFGDELSDVATLRVPNGQVWHVRRFKNDENNLGSKRCKMEELDEIKTSDAISDESEFKKAVCKVEISSSDEENERIKFDRLDLLAVLKDFGITVGCKFRFISAEEKERAITVVKLFKPKNPSFMVILWLDNLPKGRVVSFLIKCCHEEAFEFFFQQPNKMASSRTLNFFKVILPATIEEKKLRLPLKFVRKFGDELSAVVTLTVPNGRTWRVQLTKDDKKIWFLHDGWHDFVKYHSICVGFFLVFKYGKNSSFRVLIFDQSACEIQYPIYHRGPNNDEQNSNQNEMKSDDSVEIKGFTTPNSPSNSLKDKAVDESRRSSGKMDTAPSQLNKPTLGSVLGTNRHRKCGASQRKRTMTAVARERALNAARLFKPVNPFCRVVLRKSYLNRKGCLMYFPSSFAKMHLRGVSEIIKLQTTDGMQRIARCVHRGDSANLTQGWYEFALENNLGEGDVCFFEVLKSSDIVLKVTVFRVLESDSQSKRCKMDVPNEKYNITKFDDLKLLVSLEDMGISVSKTFINNTAQEKERAFAASRSIKPKHPSFMVILRRDNIKSCRVYVPAAFGNKYFNKDSKVIKRIPEKFVREYGEELSAFVRLIVPNGRVWLVGLMKDGMKPIFKKYESLKDRIAHPPNNVSPVVWKQMVDKWMGAKWQDKSKKNANNQSCVQMHHATGSVSFAKYKYEQVYIYTFGEASHGRLVGLGRGMKPEDVFGTGGSCKRARVGAALEVKIKSMKEELQQFKAMQEENEENV
ncbi:hypothetical protein EZV62_011420 [Acer yangbiense]|uniref:TF-B3 domain-containing protein n=1 Tax=Acer yangbiense TaxID=1000413 RepID=A0A5C7I7M0_9ROSI|nr:hypothetical protein EZV62_011420 [Acer yangbiense]